MKPENHAPATKEARIILKDGAAYLAGWSQQFESLPCEGEELPFPSHVAGLVQFKSFAPKGRISRVHAGGAGKMACIEIEAEPRLGFQSTVALNSAFVPCDLHMDAERVVRQGRPDARVIWEKSDEPAAVLRLAQRKDFPEAPPGDAHRSRGEAIAAAASPRPARVTLEAQLRQLLTRSREVLAHF